MRAVYVAGRQVSRSESKGLSLIISGRESVSEKKPFTPSRSHVASGHHALTISHRLFRRLAGRGLQPLAKEFQERQPERRIALHQFEKLFAVDRHQRAVGLGDRIGRARRAMLDGLLPRRGGDRGGVR